jgi:hypothetical protein
MSFFAAQERKVQDKIIKVLDMYPYDKGGSGEENR